MIKKTLLLLHLVLISAPAMLWAQRPTNVPYDTEPVRFFESWSNIIIYIIIPIIVVLIYYLWRRKINKENNQ